MVSQITLPKIVGRYVSCNICNRKGHLTTVCFDRDKSNTSKNTDKNKSRVGYMNKEFYVKVNDDSTGEDSITEKLKKNEFTLFKKLSSG